MSHAVSKENMKRFFIRCLIGFSLMCIGYIFLLYRSTYLLDHHRFGVTYMTMNNPFYEVINNELRKGIEEKGDKLITLDPALDIEKQKQQIYSFIQQKVDGIFINPIDSIEIRAALQDAKDANIPVIVIDAPIDDENLVTSTIVSDNYGAGVQCARDMMNRMDHAKIVLLKHSEVLSAQHRINGFLDVIKDRPEYEVVNEGECEGQLEIAMPIMQNILKETNDIDVVMALNDPSALGAVAALESKHKSDVIVYGVDGTPEAKSRILKNEILVGSVAQSPIRIGKYAVQTMYDALNGKLVNKEIIIPVTMINHTNIKDYDEMGWQ